LEPAFEPGKDGYMHVYDVRLRAVVYVARDVGMTAVNVVHTWRRPVKAGGSCGI